MNQQRNKRRRSLKRRSAKRDFSRHYNIGGYQRQLFLEQLEDRRLLAADFGDAPEPYPVTLAEDGVRHEATGPQLGSTRDSEVDGTHSGNADADGADEDGVTFGTIMVGQLDATVTVNVQNAPEGAKLDAWIDFNGDGSWGGPGEQIADSGAVVNGDNTLAFDVPSWAQSGQTFSRFRLSTSGDLGMGGAAADGEVEDYEITINASNTGSGSFSSELLVSNQTTVFSIATADINNDGHLDVVSAAGNGAQIAWHENNGNQVFSKHVVSAETNDRSFISTADVNGDGNIDILTSSMNDNAIRWYENSGSNNFQMHLIGTISGRSHGIFTADMDGDGDLDVLAANYDAGSIDWFENDGSENFSSHQVGDGARHVRGLFAADIDNDGDMDIAAASEEGPRLRWFENDGQQTFTGHDIANTSDRAMNVFVTDMDADGDSDLVAVFRGDDRVVWFRNNGNELFEEIIIASDADNVHGLYVADADGDGDMDVFSASNNDQRIAWYENDGNQNFTTHTISTESAEPFNVAIGDLDQDGDLDVLSASYSDKKIAWYEHNAKPTLDAIADLTIGEDAPEQAVNLTGISAGGDETESVRITAISNNTVLVLTPTVDYTTGNSTGSIKFTPVADQHGTATITVTVEDAGLDGDFDKTADNATFSRTFDVIVSAVNADPTLDAIDNITIAEDADEQTVNLAGITAGGGESQPLRVTVSSSNTDLIPDPTVTYASANATGSIAFTPLPDQYGSTTITVTVEDGGLDNNLETSDGNGTFSRTFDVTVTPVNDEPLINVDVDNSFNQLGQSLLGYSNELSLSGDGLTFAVSLANTSVDSGSVVVYRFSSLTQSWNLLGSGLSEQSPGDAAGDSISLSEDGNTIAIGAPGHSQGPTNYYPEVRVYKYDMDAKDWRLTTGADSWMVQSDIVGDPRDKTGYSVSLNAAGNIVAVGAISRYDKTSWPRLYGSGSIRIYEYNTASDSWSLMGPEIYGEGANDEFGTSVSISNDGHTVAVGAPKNDGNGTDAGHACVYEYNPSTSTWNQLDNDIDGTASRKLGSSVSISGDGLTLAVTAPGQTWVNPVEIFRYDSTSNAWQTLGAPLNIPGTFHVRTIADVSLNEDGSRIVIGDESAHGDDTWGSLRGGAYVYEYSESTDTWNIVVGGIYGEEPGYRSGSAVSLNDDGLSVAVLTPLYSSEYGYGQVKVFSQGMNYTIEEDADEQTVNMNGISPGNSESQNLLITATSSNTSLIADPTVVYISDEAIGSLKFTPLADQSGTTTITVTLTDGGLDNDLDSTEDNATATQSFDITVTPTNDAPTLDALDNITIAEDAAEQTVALSGIGPGPNETEAVRITTISSNTNLIPNPTVDYTTADATGSIAFTPVPDQYGTATITVIVEDAGPDGDFNKTADNATFSRTFDVTVNPINDLPTLDPISWNLQAVEGANAGENFGYSVAISQDGQVMAVGSLNDDTGGNQSGKVSVFRNESATWVPLGEPLLGQPSERAGYVVTLNATGNVLAFSNHQFGAGSVYLYQFNEATEQWESFGQTLQGTNDGDQFGTGVELDDSGNRVVIGAADGNYAKVFEYDGTSDTWSQLGNTLTGHSRFGRQAAMSGSGEVIVIGAQHYGSMVYAYNSTSGNWEQHGGDILKQGSSDIEDVTISQDGSVVATGEIVTDNSTPGHTRVFQYAPSSSSWIMKGNLIEGQSNGDWFGYSVSLTDDGERLTASGYLGDLKQANDGYVRVYDFNGATAQWDQAFEWSGENSGDYAGHSVGISGDGTRFAAAVIRYNDDAGKVVVFDAYLTIAEDAPEQTMNLTGITAGGGEVQPLRVTAVSSDTDLIPNPTVTYTSAEATGTLKFTPLADQNGTATITVTVEDGGLDNNLDTLEGNGTFSRTFQVDVTPVNDLPIVGDATYRPLDNTRLDKNQVTGLATLVTDIDEDALTFSVVAGPSDGQLVLNEDGSFHYTPSSNFNRNDFFTYVANDGTVDSNIGTVTLKIDTDYTWYNCREPRDVNADNLVTPLDALWIINTINNLGSQPLTKIRTEGIVKPFLDVNRDAQSTPLDALWIINYLNQQPLGEGEGASETPAAALAIDLLMSEQANSTIHPERAIRPVATDRDASSQPVPDNTPYWQRVDETFDSIIRTARRSQLSDAATDRDRDDLFEQSDWLDFLGKDEAI